MLGALVDQFLVVQLQGAGGLQVRLLALAVLLQQHLVVRLQEAVDGVVLVAMKALEEVQVVLLLDTLVAVLGARLLAPQALQYQDAVETFRIYTQTSC